MGRIARYFDFIDFGDICRNCNVNCCRRFYAVLLPEEEKEYEGISSTVETDLGPVKCLGRIGRTCPFLSTEGLCLNYKNRPFDCRVWPILLYYDFKTGEKVVYLDMDCPAVAEGRIKQEFVDNVVKLLRSIDIDVEWLKKYTLAPWPNNLKEIARWK